MSQQMKSAQMWSVECPGYGEISVVAGSPQQAMELVVGNGLTAASWALGVKKLGTVLVPVGWSGTARDGATRSRVDVLLSEEPRS